jgi:ATP-binding cassette, subfamily B, bacterial
MSTERQVGDIRLYVRVLREARAYWPHLAASFVLDLLATPLLLAGPVPLKLAVDNVLGGSPAPRWLAAIVPTALRQTRLELLALAAFLTVAIVLATQLRELASNTLTTRIGEGLTRRFRARLFRHVQDLSLYFHDTRGTSDSIFRIQYDAPALQWITINGFMPFVTSMITFFTMMVVIARISTRLALVALVVAPVLFALFHHFRDRIRTGYREVRGMESSAFTVVDEVLGSLRVVKAFGRESTELARFEERSTAGAEARVGLAMTEGRFSLLINATVAAGSAAVLYLGARSVMEHTLTLGALLMILAYLTQLYGPLKTISKTAGTLQSSLANAERAFQLLDEIPSVQERPNARPLARARGEVEFQGVAFSYDGTRRVLDEVSFRVPPGARTGVVGRTGAGKTTLVSLMTRFYDPAEGVVRLDGVDIRDLRLADLREQFAVVLQEPVLFSTSIAENIAYARPSAGRSEIEAAARAAGAHDFIVALPDGYDTLVGERGMKLSGGERQRVSLARAFLRDAPILILDEPTSSVDTGTEDQILAAMSRLMAGRTTFLIAHRPSTLRHCDLLLRLEQGRVWLEPVTGAQQAEAMGGDGA